MTAYNRNDETSCRQSTHDISSSLVNNLGPLWLLARCIQGPPVAASVLS